MRGRMAGFICCLRSHCGDVRGYFFFDKITHHPLGLNMFLIECEIHCVIILGVQAVHDKNESGTFEPIISRPLPINQ